MTYGHLQADCLYTGISSGPNARYRAWESLYLTFYAYPMHALELGVADLGELKSTFAQFVRRSQLFNEILHHLSIKTDSPPHSTHSNMVN